KTLLDRREGFSVVGEAGSVAEAISAARQTRPDVIVMDIRLPDGNGVEACREIRGELPDTKVIMLTSYADDEAVYGSIMAGASGVSAQADARAEPGGGNRARGQGGIVAGPLSYRESTGAHAIAGLRRRRRAGRAIGAGKEDSGADRPREDQQGDCRGGIPERQDCEELRVEHPQQAE